MTKIIEVKEKKAHVAKAKVPNYSLYNNLNPNVSVDTQTVSNKKLIKPLMHSIGLVFGKSNPIPNNGKNEKQFTKLLNQNKISKLQYMLNPDGFMANVSKQTVL